MERNGRRPGADPLATEIAALEADLAATRVLLAALRLRLALKANFDPNQPRVPPGHGRQSGRWTDGNFPGAAGSGGGKPVPEGGRPETTVYKNPPRFRMPLPKQPLSHPPALPLARPQDASPGTPKPGQSLHPMEPPPPIPPERPVDGRVRNRVAVVVAKWAIRMALRSAVGPLGHLWTAYELGSWIYEAARPYVEAYFDAPKRLAELNAGVANRQAGYDVHHIVERTPALQDGFPPELVDGPDNLVLIPTLKHWEVTTWFGRRQDAYGGLSPREYLRGRSWSERRRVGLDGLRIVGVLAQ